MENVKSTVVGKYLTRRSPVEYTRSIANMMSSGKNLLDPIEHNISNDMGAAPPSASLAETPAPSVTVAHTVKSMTNTLEAHPAFRLLITQLKAYILHSTTGTALGQILDTVVALSNAKPSLQLRSLLVAGHTGGVSMF
jgi:hypothetical protein